MYLITDPQSIEEVDYFEVNMDGSVTQVDAERDTDQGLARLHMSLDGITAGDHSVSVAAVNGWGRTAFTAPLDFVASLPSVPSGLSLSLD